MRVLLVVLLLLAPGYASAIFYNNTEVIEIGDGVPPEPSEEEGGPFPSGETPPGSGGADNPSAGGAETGGGTNGGGGGSVGGGSSGGGVSGGATGSGDGNAATEDDVISALIASGALSGSGIESGSLGDITLGAGGNGAGATIRVVGERVREVFESDLDLRELLQYWRRGSGESTAKDLGLIAASTALRDRNVQEVSFAAAKFEITYRSRGYLLAVIPWSFPVRIAIVPEAGALDERVQVRLPWYRFFVREFFTVRGLQRDIDAVITTTKENDADPDAGNALLFEAIARYLQQKIGTIGNSILLGTPTQ